MSIDAGKTLDRIRDRPMERGPIIERKWRLYSMKGLKWLVVLVTLMAFSVGGFTMATAAEKKKDPKKAAASSKAGDKKMDKKKMDKKKKKDKKK